MRSKFVASDGRKSTDDADLHVAYMITYAGTIASGYGR